MERCLNGYYLVRYLKVIESTYNVRLLATQEQSLPGQMRREISSLLDGVWVDSRRDETTAFGERMIL